MFIEMILFIEINVMAGPLKSVCEKTHDSCPLEKI